MKYVFLFYIINFESLVINFYSNIKEFGSLCTA